MNGKKNIPFVKRRLEEIWCCETGAFDSDENVFSVSDETFFEVATFGGNAVFRGSSQIIDWCSQEFESIPACDILDGDNLYKLDTMLRSLGKKLSGEHIRYLRLFPEKRVEKPAGFTYRLHSGDEVKELYIHKGFDNALNYRSDVIALVAYDGEEIAAMAGADNNMGDLWQIGIDTLPQYRKKGLGVYLVNVLAEEIEKLGKVAFYTTWSPNIASTRVALGAGFCPVWMGYPSASL